MNPATGAPLKRNVTLPGPSHTRPRPQGKHALLGLTKAQLINRLECIDALLGHIDAPTSHICGTKAVWDHWGYPGEVAEPVWVGDKDVAAVLDFRYTDGELCRQAANAFFNYWVQKGLYEVYHDHALCTLKPRDKYDPGHPDDELGHEDGGHRCRRMVTMLPPEQWEPRPPRPRSEHRPPRIDPAKCPHCGSHEVRAVKCQCNICNKPFIPGEPFTLPQPAKARGVAKGIRALPAPDPDTRVSALPDPPSAPQQLSLCDNPLTQRVTPSGTPTLIAQGSRSLNRGYPSAPGDPPSTPEGDQRAPP